MQNPKIKLFYILTVKTIKDIYIMNEKERCGLLLWRCSIHSCPCAVCFLSMNVRNISFHEVIPHCLSPQDTAAMVLSYNDIVHLIQ